MPDLVGLPATSPSGAQPSSTNNDPARVRDAACQFESLMIAQLMKSMHEGGKGWLSDGNDDDQAGETATQLAEEQFAQSLARQGGLGLARMVVSGLQAQTEGASASVR